MGTLYYRICCRAIGSRSLVAASAILIAAALGLGVAFYAQLHFYGVYIFNGYGTIMALRMPGGGYLRENLEIIPLLVLLCITIAAASFASVQHRLRRKGEAWLDVFVVAVMSLMISVTLFS